MRKITVALAIFLMAFTGLSAQTIDSLKKTTILFPSITTMDFHGKYINLTGATSYVRLRYGIGNYGTITNSVAKCR